MLSRVFWFGYLLFMNIMCVKVSRIYICFLDVIFFVYRLSGIDIGVFEVRTISVRTISVRIE